MLCLKYIHVAQRITKKRTPRKLIQYDDIRTTLLPAGRLSGKHSTSYVCRILKFAMSTLRTHPKLEKKKKEKLNNLQKTQVKQIHYEIFGQENNV